MKNIVFISIFSMCLNQLYSQNSWAFPSYKLHDLVLYSGSGTSTRHLEQNYFAGRYNHYIKSPFLSFGLDYCFVNTDALWGLGFYFSGSVGAKEFNRSNALIDKFWTNSLSAVKFTHHNKYFIRRKIDMCSGYIVGARIKSYEKVYLNDKEITDKSKLSVNLAIGISFMFKYYPSDFFAIYAEGALGYNVDLPDRNCKKIYAI
jgi:hypothetical protein